MSQEQYLETIENHLPLLVQIKKDGFRCLINEKQYPRSRTDKQIPNKWIKNCLHDMKLPFGFDGELETINSEGRDNFNAIQSKVSSELGTPLFTYTVFDWFGSEPYEKRYARAQKYFNENLQGTCIDVINSHLCKTIHEVMHYYRLYTELNNYEGICLRKPTGKYKQGRSTINEGLLFALTPWETSEATIVGVEVARDQQYGTTKNMLGAIQCRDSKNFTEDFFVGSGFTEQQRIDIWNDTKKYYPLKITYKYKANRTTKDRPISPIFKGFRSGVEL